MAQNNEDFKDFMFKRVELQYPRLKDTFRYNSAAKKSEPCAPGAANAAWSVVVKLPKAEAKQYYADMKAHYEACRKRNSKLPEFTKVFGMKKDEENGTVTFEAKKKGMNAAGAVNKPPTVIDSSKNAWPSDKLDFWSGSIGTVRMRAFPTVDPDGEGGISLLLDVVQVLKPVYGGANLDGFDEDTEYGAPDFQGDPFQAAGAKKPAATVDDSEF